MVQIEALKWVFQKINACSGLAAWTINTANSQPLQWLFTDIKQYEKMALLLVIVVAVVFGSVRWLRLRCQ